MNVLRQEVEKKCIHLLLLFEFCEIIVRAKEKKMK